MTTFTYDRVDDMPSAVTIEEQMIADRVQCRAEGIPIYRGFYTPQGRIETGTGSDSIYVVGAIVDREYRTDHYSGTPREIREQMYADVATFIRSHWDD